MHMYRTVAHGGITTLSLMATWRPTGIGRSRCNTSERCGGRRVLAAAGAAFRAWGQRLGNGALNPKPIITF